MSALAIGGLGVAFLLLLIFLRVPVAIALAASGIAGYAAIEGWPRTLQMAGTVPFTLATAYTFSVIPLFVLMGAVASRANMARELFEACNAAFSGFRGALANASIGSCTLFGAICGSSAATAATFARVAIPQMRAAGYEPALAAGAIASAGTLAVLIPPSVLLAVYAITAEESLADLYAAAIVPGLVLAVLYVLTVFLVAALRPAWVPRVPGMPMLERLRALRGIWKLGVLFFLALGGIYLGWFSPTEAASVSAFAAIVIAFATRSLTLAGLRDAILETLLITAAIFLIILGAFLFSRFIVLTRAASDLAGWVQAAELAPILVVLAIAAFYVALGTFLDEVSCILITVPVLLPIMNAIGYDGVWFGVFVTIMCTIGLISPPTGMTVFVIQAQFRDIPVERIYLGTLPFLCANFVVVGLIIAFPGLVSFFPRLLQP